MARISVDELSALLGVATFQPDVITHDRSQQDAARLSSQSQPFPLLKLPTEIRLSIYGFALQQTFDDLVSPPFGTPKLMGTPHLTFAYANGPTRLPTGMHRHKRRSRCPPIVGALALLHTSRGVRAESIDGFDRLASKHVERLSIHADHVYASVLSESVLQRMSRVPLLKSRMERCMEVLSLYPEARDDWAVAKWVCKLVIRARNFDLAAAQKRVRELADAQDYARLCMGETFGFDSTLGFGICTSKGNGLNDGSRDHARKEEVAQFQSRRGGRPPARLRRSQKKAKELAEAKLSAKLISMKESYHWIHTGSNCYFCERGVPYRSSRPSAPQAHG